MQTWITNKELKWECTIQLLTRLDEGAIPHLPKIKKGFLEKVDPSSTTPTKTKDNVDIDDFK
jgi:hypothetical protein